MTNEVSKSRDDAGALSVAPDKIGLVLPCEVKHFGEFVSSLLGKSQTIQGIEMGTFDIERLDVENAVHLLVQRVEAQNDASVAAFEISVIYNNGNKVTHNSIEAFRAYHQVEPSHPAEVNVSLTFLVKFVGREIPEKQRAEISFVAEHHHQRRTQGYYVGQGAIEYKVEYTERTWGSDIATILKNHAKALISKRNTLISRCADWFDEISMVFFAACFLTFTALWSWKTSLYFQEENITAVIPYLAWSVFIFCSLGTFLVVLLKLFEHRLYIGGASYIVLVERDKKSRADKRKKQNRKLLLAGGGWLASVAASLLASYIYAQLVSG